MLTRDLRSGSDIIAPPFPPSFPACSWSRDPTEIIIATPGKALQIDHPEDKGLKNWRIYANLKVFPSFRAPSRDIAIAPDVTRPIKGEKGEILRTRGMQ